MLTALSSFCMVPGGGQAPCRPTLDLHILKALGCCETACGCSVTLGAGTADEGQLVNLICRESSQELHACTAHLICSCSQSTLQLACEEALLWLNSCVVVFSVIYCVCMVVQLAPGFNSQIFSLLMYGHLLSPGTDTCQSSSCLTDLPVEIFPINGTLQDPFPSCVFCLAYFQGPGTF